MQRALAALTLIALFAIPGCALLDRTAPDGRTVGENVGEKLGEAGPIVTAIPGLLPPGYGPLLEWGLGALGVAFAGKKTLEAVKRAPEGKTFA